MTENQPKSTNFKVEVALFLFMLAYGITLPLKTEYLKYRFLMEYHLPAEESDADCHVNKSSRWYPTVQAVNNKTALWAMYLSVALSIPAFLSSIYYGHISDVRGRRFPLIATTLGLTAYSVINLFVIQFNANLHLLALASFILGSSGDFISFMSAGFAYVADITSKENRMLRIVIAETMTTLGGGPGQLGTGFLIETFGYDGPYVLILSCCLLLMVYLIWLPETVNFDDEKKGKTDFKPNEMILSMRDLFRPRPGGRCWKLIAYNTVVFAYIGFAFGFVSVTLLYTTNGSPFCFSPTLVGYYEAAQFFSCGLGMILGGLILPLCMSDFVMMHISAACFIINLVLCAFVENPAFFFAITIFGVFRLLCAPICRSKMSKLVGPEEQGIMFAVSGCTQGLAVMIAVPGLNALFPLAATVWPGFIFIIMAVLLIIPWVLITCLHISELRANDSPENYLPIQADRD